MINKYFISLTVCLIIVAVYFSIQIFQKMTTVRFDYNQPEGTDTQNESTPSDEMHQTLSHRPPIIKHHPFDSKTDQNINSKNNRTDEYENTDSNLKLWGTVTGDNDRRYAIIEETTKRQQKIYVQSDVIQNATLKVILRDKVVLRVNGKDEILEIETKNADVNAQDKYGVTALMDASERGLKEAVALLIAEGADVNAQDNYGDTALMYAALKGYSQIVELLLGNRADVHLKDNSGSTALIDSAKYAGESACKVISLLIDNGADVNATNKYGVTALMDASLRGHADNVECLIVEGAKVDAESKSGETAVKFAALANHKNIVELLEKHSAKIE